MKTGESQTPQFTTAEYERTGAMKCAACQDSIRGTYFQIKGAPVCTECTAKIRAQIPQDSHAAFARALVFGVAGALAGLALYVIFALSTGLIIGWVSLAVGFIVGKAMRLGSRGVGGRRYQVAAVLLTYFAVSMSAVPIALEQGRQDRQARMQHPVAAATAAGPTTDAPPRVGMSFGKAVAMLGLLGIASPILELRDPVQGLIGLVILFVGIRFAWRFTARQTVNVSGPYTAAAVGAT
jgi:uncharacterized protein (DUF983 family)